MPTHPADPRPTPALTGAAEGRFEEEPDEIPEPDEPDEPEPDGEPAGGGAAAAVPVVGGGPEREWEYRVDVVTDAQVLDGKTLPELLGQASRDEWQLVEIIDAGGSKAILLRKVKKNDRPRRPVGFARR